MVRDRAAEPFDDEASDLQIALLQHDHMRIAMDPVIAETQLCDLYASLNQYLTAQ
jgi:hypothetical protein